MRRLEPLILPAIAALLTLAAGACATADKTAKPPSALPDRQDKRNVERPDEASAQSTAMPAATAEPSTYGGGTWVKGTKTDDLAEPPSTVAAGKSAPGTGEYSEPGAPSTRHQRFVDAEGRIYKDRNYHGIIPGVRNLFRPSDLERLAGKDYVSWTGFQPMEKTSRLFWQLTAEAPAFEVVKVDERTVEVRLPRSRPHKYNHRRPLVTGHFDTPVERVDAKRTGGGTVFTVRLKRGVAFLYRFEAPFLYVDFEHGGATPAK